MSFPIVRLELQGMRQTILHAFTHHQIEVDSQVQAAVDSAIREFDIAAYVRKEVQIVMSERLHQAVLTVCGEILRDPKINDSLYNLMYKALEDQLSKLKEKAGQ